MASPDISINDTAKVELRTSKDEYDRFIENVVEKHGKKRGVLGIEAGRAMWLWSETREMGYTPEEVVALLRYQANMGRVESEVEALCGEIRSAVRESKENVQEVRETNGDGVSDGESVPLGEP